MDYNNDVVSELNPQNIATAITELPEGVEVMAAAKAKIKTLEEFLEAIRAGIKII